MELAMTNKKTMRNLTGIADGIRAEILMLAFFAVNALKITVFNMLMVNSYPVQAFLYKLGITFLLLSATYILLLGIGSRIPFVIFYAIQTIYILVNLIYYEYLHSYLHISQAVALFSEGVGAAGDVSTLISPKLFVALLDLPVAVYMLVIYPRVTAQVKKAHKVGRLALAMCCLLVIAATEGYNYAHHYSIFNLAEAGDSVSESLVVQRYGTIANSLADMILNRKDNNLISRLKYGQHLSGKGTDADRPNFVVIQVESMDANAVNKQHDGRYVMPFLHSLAQQNVYYPYTMSYHEAGGTSDCEFSAINSVEPLSDYPSMKINDYDYPNSIVRQLAGNSYDTVAFHGNVGSYFNRDVAYPKMGYRELADMAKMGLKDVGWGAPDNDVFSYAENRLKNEKQPFFAYTITMTSHGPFTNADNYYNNAVYDDVKDPTARNYMNSMSYVDQSVASYVNYIRANFKNTYIFILGDHTPNVNSGDYRQTSFTEGDKYFEFVPLIIVTPDNRQYREDNIAASFLDIAPTIANASGVPYSIDSDGMDLLNRTEENNNRIPYKGESFDRSYLLEKISKIK